MFENLSERLERSFKILKGEGKITEINVAVVSIGMIHLKELKMTHRRLSNSTE